ncbi:MAG TPA: cytochrome c-type biogenesis protein CcmH [Gemmatimonadaceae bacterium]|jgi:cytochrome c-type biogenesis protein CcmH|nr:cytochrome c-type biogenesis protein CcmH [Gemmatimonadaceae bacterium]
MSDDALISRRRFFVASAAGAAVLLAARVARAQEGQEGGQANTGAANTVMESDRFKSVVLPPKGEPVLDQAKRDELEHHIHCQCGCNLDVYTCRTTDFSCQVSPAMHRDVMALVAGGYSATEIIAAFKNVYGDRVLMAPPSTGFDLAAWITPFVALSAGIALVLVVLKRLRAPTLAPAISPAAADATPAEQARLDALVRNDDR